MPTTTVSPKIEYKTLSFKVETVDEDQGIITGYLSTFNNIDRGNGYIQDRVRPGAFKRTIAHALERKSAKGKKYLWPHLWMHDPNIPIGGYVDAKEDARGLLVTYQLDISKNAASIPNNPTATMVFSGYKHGYVDEQSIGYEVIDSEMGEEVVDGKKTMVRDLIEIRLWEGSSITSNFAMDPEATVTGIKSVASDDLDYKTVCGNTSGPIGPRDESWDGAAAKREIWAAAEKEDGSINTSLAKKYFMTVDGDAQQKGSYGYPFWRVGSDPHICVGAVKTIAGAIQGARGADAPSGLKAKVETLYGRINSKYPDNPLPPVPWKDDGKSNLRSFQKKTFEEHYAEEQCEDLLEDWQDVLLCALSAAVLDAFKIGDQPEADIEEALTAFHEAAMAWVALAIQYKLSDYLDEASPDWSPADYTIQYGSESKPDYGYHARNGSLLSRKALLASDATTGGYTADHVDKLKNAASKAMQKVQGHADALHDAADSVSSLVNSTKSLQLTKAGRMFSGANIQKLSDHADSLHDAADSLTKGVKRNMNAVNAVADDLAQRLQGSEPAYGTNPGNAGDQQEGKQHTRAASSDGTRRLRTRSSDDDTVPEEHVNDADFTALRALRTQLLTTTS